MIFRTNNKDWPDGMPIAIAVVKAGLAKTVKEAQKFISENKIFVMANLCKWSVVGIGDVISEKNITSYSYLFGGNIVLWKGKPGKTIGSGKVKAIHWETKCI